MSNTNIIKIINKIVNSGHFEAQINIKNLENILKQNEIKLALDKQILSENIINPSRCKVCGAVNIETKIIKNSFYIFCKDCREKYSESLTLNIFYRTSISIMAEEIFKFIGLTPTILEDKEYYMFGNINWDNYKFTFIFFLKKINIEEILSIFYRISQIGGYILCIVRDFNLEEILDLYSFVTFGKEIKIIPLSVLNKKEIIQWLNFSSEILGIENQILDEFNEKFKELIIKINENPQFALTLLTNLKVRKQIEKGEFDWQLYENIIAIIFNQLYPSDISIGGGRNIGSDIQDSLFIVNNREEQPIIYAAIECKSSLLADLSREPTEKYINYFNKMKKYANLAKVKYTLIFVLFNYKNTNLIKFFDRIEKELSQDQYLVILPIDTIIVLTEIYFNIILRGELRKKDKEYNFTEILINIFDDNFLKKLKTDFSEDYKDIIGKEKLYKLNHKHLFEIIKSCLKSSGSIQEFFFNRYKSN